MSSSLGLILGMVYITGLLNNQREKSINLYFIRVPLKKSIKARYSKAQHIGYGLYYYSSIPIIEPNIYTHQYSEGGLSTLTKTVI